MSVGSDVADLAILLCIIGVPLAVGAVFIPIGRALADRIRNEHARRSDLDGVERALHAVDARIGALAKATELNAMALERLAARRLPELPRSHGADAVRPITPH